MDVTPAMLGLINAFAGAQYPYVSAAKPRIDSLPFLVWIVKFNLSLAGQKKRSISRGAAFSYLINQQERGYQFVNFQQTDILPNAWPGASPKCKLARNLCCFLAIN